MSIPEKPAESIGEAGERYERWIGCDPFPKISSTLLNSADVYDYVRATGMIFPFDHSRLKASSYKVAIGGRYIYWDESGNKHDRWLDGSEEFNLNPNSIGFVVTREYFRLPHYIAARFNLRITNVHRGILLGTGPLVDPGFEGRLLVPLHNLTTNRYLFHAGEDFAWFEFTKVSPNTWDGSYDRLREEYGLRGQYVPFPRQRVDLDPNEYLKKAWKGSIRSSIPEAVAQSEESAKNAQRNAERANNSAEGARTEARDAKTAAEKAQTTFNRIGIAAIFGGAVAVAAIVIPSYQLVAQISSVLADLQANHAELRTRVDEILPAFRQDVVFLSRKIENLAGDAEDLGRTLHDLAPATMQAQLDSLRAAVADVQAQIDALRRELEER